MCPRQTPLQGPLLCAPHPVCVLSGGLGRGRGGPGGIGETARVVDVSPHLEAEGPGASYWPFSLGQ